MAEDVEIVNDSIKCLSQYLIGVQKGVKEC